MAIVAGVCFALLCAYVATGSTRVPFLDDVTMAEWLQPGRTQTPEILWMQHNEHRIPLPRLVYVALACASGDLRAGLWLDVVLLGVLTLLFVNDARALRGRSHPTDAVFPLLLFSLGNSENLLSAFQLTLILPAVLSGILLSILVRRDVLGSVPVSILTGAVLILSILCGTVGVVPAVAVGVWLFLAGLLQLRRGDRREQRAARAACAAALATGLFVLFYFHDFRTAPEFVPAGVIRSLKVAAEFSSQGLGCIAEQYWPGVTLLVAGCLAGAIALACAAWMRAPSDRWRSSGFLFHMGGMLALAIAVGWGRGGGPGEPGFTNRYTILGALPLCAAQIAACTFSGRLPARCLSALILALAAAAFLANVEPARKYARTHVEAARAFEADALADLGVRAIAARHWTKFYYGEVDFARELEALRRSGFLPFVVPGERLSDEATRDSPYPMLGTQPLRVESPAPVRLRLIDGRYALVIERSGCIVLPILPGAYGLRGRFRAEPAARDHRRERGLRFTIEIVRAGRREVLFERELRPLIEPDDASPQRFRCEIPPGAEGEIWARVESLGPIGTDPDRAAWFGLEVRY